MAKPEGSPGASYSRRSLGTSSTSCAAGIATTHTTYATINWSHFKPKFSGKPEEDAEAHLLRTKDWMDTHRFQEDDKVQRFCLTLTEEARLWYESLRLINTDWTELQISFRQQYSKIGNTREQVISCMEILSFQQKHRNNRYLCTSYKTGCHTLRLWGTTNTLRTRLYWVHFPLANLQLAVEAVKRILTKGKIDRQLVGHSSSTPFMNIQEDHNKRIKFDMTDSR